MDDNSPFASSLIFQRDGYLTGLRVALTDSTALHRLKMQSELRVLRPLYFLYIIEMGFLISKTDLLV